MPQARTIQHGCRRARRAATNPTDSKEIRVRLVATLVLGLLLGAALPAFADHSLQLAGGATKGRLTVDHHGGVTLTVVGHGLDPARFGTGLGVATRVGNRCSGGATELPWKHKRLIFP